MKKMAIMGVGAIGSLLGGYISLAGEDITLIDPWWREHIEAMRQRGLRIDGCRGEHLVRVKALHTDELSQLEGKLDILFIAVKSYDTERMLTLMKPYLKEDAWVVSCQNSINEDVIISIVGASRTIGCVVTLRGELWGPGHVTQTGRPDRLAFTVGELDGKITPRIREVARITNLCAESKITTNIWGDRWAKLAMNCMANSMAGITGYQSSDLFKNRPVYSFCHLIGAEVIQVAEALGYKVELIWGRSAEFWKRSAVSPSPEIDEAMLSLSRNLAVGRSSLLQDIIKGRPTEIDYLNGYLVKRGKEAGIPTPANEAALSLVKEIESGKLKPSPANIDILQGYYRRQASPSCDKS